MNGICGIPLQNGAPWKVSPFRNLNTNYCKPASSKCLAAAGGIGNIYTPYFKTNAPGTKGCGFLTGSAAKGVLGAGITAPPCTTSNWKSKKFTLSGTDYVAGGTGQIMLGSAPVVAVLSTQYPGTKALYFPINSLSVGVLYFSQTFPDPQTNPLSSVVLTQLDGPNAGNILIYSATLAVDANGQNYYQLFNTNSNTINGTNSYCVRLFF